MAQQHTIGKTATTTATGPDGITRVTYHSTVVVSFTPDKVTLCHGGWRTPTTKTRMNQAANQYGLGFEVVQRDFDWIVRTSASEYRFDGGTFTFDRHTGLSI